MARTPDPVVASRDAAIIDAYQKDVSQNLTKLAETFGVTYGNVHRILTKANVFQRNRTVTERRPRKKFVDLRPITPLHYHIGNTLSMWRLSQPGTPEVPRAELAKSLNISSVELHKIELGLADLTLSQLTKISECIGIPLTRLLENKPVSFVRPSTTGASAGFGGASGLAPRPRMSAVGPRGF